MRTRQLGCLLALGLFLLGCSPEEPVISSPAQEQTATVAGADHPVSEPAADQAITIGSIDRLYSEILDEQRELWIYLPYDDLAETNGQRYPVVFLLDGSSHFHSVTGLIHQLSSVNGNAVLPKMIVVGIPNTNRYRDLTPTETEAGSGGGTAFLDFIEREAIPHVESSYPASPYRTFIGHSLGGLMAIEALVERPQLFANYIAIDPSLWWDERAILNKAEAALNEQDFTGKSLFVSVANTMRDGITFDTVRADENPQTSHIRSILQFAETAERDDSSGLNFAWAYYDDDSHVSVPLISEYDAVRFLFPWYNPGKQISRFYNPEYPDSPEESLAAIGNHFQQVSQRFGYEELPPRNWVSREASIFRNNDKPQTARALLQLNLGNYPELASTHEAMADFLLGQGQTEAARVHFQHAIDRGATIDIEQRLADHATE